jgi:putative colanic acid biosynthesis acetyltransferase WcaF
LRLDRYNNFDFDRGRSRLIEGLWRACEGLLLNSWVPGSFWRVSLLRLFGAKIGQGVIIKPHVRVKFPWRLRIGNHSWIGESVWIDNLAEVGIGNHCCISQGAYLCTGSHRWDRETFDLVLKPISVQDNAWIGSFAKVAPGVIVEEGAVLTMGSVAVSNLMSGKIYAGQEVIAVKERTDWQ